MDISEIVCVQVTWERLLERSYFLVQKKDLDTFVESCVELHSGRCVNPHSGLLTSRVVQIATHPVVFDGPYWWTTPGLHETANHSGAQVFCITNAYSVVWPEQLKKEEV